jgi:hypothetical protein
VDIFHPGNVLVYITKLCRFVAACQEIIEVFFLVLAVIFHGICGETAIAILQNTAAL